MEKVFAAAGPPAGNYVQQYTTAQKEIYLPPANHTPSYDAAGNLLSDGWWTYEYDGENRLIRQASVVYHPDALGGLSPDSLCSLQRPPEMGARDQYYRSG